MVDYKIPVYYNFRFTFPFQTRETVLASPRDTVQCKVREISKTILDTLVPAYTNKLTCGVEFKNSRNEPTWCHMHCAFIAWKSRDTIAKALQREMDKSNYVCRGNKTFSLKPIAEVRDENKFFRYPLKQIRPEDQNNKNWAFTRAVGFTQQELEEMRTIAHEQWLTSVEINNQKADRSDTNDTLFSKLSGIVKVAMDNEKTPDLSMNFRWIQKQVLAFYVQEEKPLNFSTMSGYSYLLGYRYGVISEDKILDKFS